MSWLAKLYETYEAGMLLDLPADQKLMPISHTLQNAHIKIVIDGSGNFQRAEVLEKTQIVLPATEESAGRSGKIPPPHPLADKLQYIASDYPEYGGRKPSFFPAYEAQLKKWCDSSFAHQKALAIHSYINKGSVVSDLIREGVIHLGNDGKLLAYWSDESDTPPIFRVLPTLPKEKRIEKDKAEIEQGDALVCWQVEVPGEPQSETWTDRSLQDSWIQYQSIKGGTSGFCYVTGSDCVLATNHPAKLRHSGDKAKLLSSNDSSGFTFRGRFTEGDGGQAAAVGYEVTQKAHNALRWLIDRQGYRNGDQVFVAWAISGKDIPEPLHSSFDLLSQPLTFQEPVENQLAEEIDHTIDLGASFAHKFNKYLKGYRAKLEPNEQILIMGFDSATPGRMGVIYYRQLLASEFFDRLENWHENFSWPQRHIIETDSAGNGKGGQKKTIWSVSAPAPRNIAEAAYGDVLKSNDTLRKNLLERIVPAIIDGRPFPQDIMMNTVRRVSNRNSIELWEWERNLGVACALYRGVYQRHPNKQQRREYTMSLDESRTTRDYLYGRLLAVAEKIEEVALSVAGENRPTTAARLMQRYADRPFSTWRTLELSLQPYMQRLQSSRGGFLTNRKKETDKIMSSFTEGDFESDRALSGEFLLGYHCQRMFYRQQTTED